MIDKKDLKNRFSTGMIPTELDFSEIIDGLWDISDNSISKETLWSSFRINEYLTNIGEDIDDLQSKHTTLNQRLDLAEQNTNQTKVAISQNHKKTKDLAKTISNVNVNQEAKQTLETDAQIASLPVNAGNGALDATLKGITATNVIRNGDFSDETLAWTGISGTTEISDSQLIMTSHGISPVLRGFYTLTFSPSSKYWVKAKIMLTHTDGIEATRLFTRSSSMGSISGTFTSEPVNDVWCGHSAILDIPTEPEVGNLQLAANYASAEDAVGATMKIDNVQLINLTQIFGAGNEPTKEQCDIIFDTYFNGTKSYTPGRVKSVGKNLFDDELESGTISSSGDLYGDADRVRSVNFIPVKGGGEYTVSGSNRWLIAQYDSNYNFVSRLSAVAASMSVRRTLDNETRYLKLSPSIDEVSTYEFQLEEGSTATDYEPYTETVQYVEPVKLNRLPNGVADEITADGDFIQRVKEYTLVASDFDTYFTTYDNVDLLRTETILSGGTFTNDINNGTIVEKFPREVYRSGISTYYTTSDANAHATSATRLYIILPKGTYASLTEAAADLADIKIWYQLDEPIIHKNVTTGNPIAHPKGTVYFEHFQTDAGMYFGGFTTTDTSHAIESLETLSLVDFMTGDEVNLDVSKAVITDNSFTHPDLSDGDLIFLTYEFKAPGPNGNKSLSFYDSRYTIKDDVTGQFYKWKVSVENGVPKLEVEDV